MDRDGNAPARNLLADPARRALFPMETVAEASRNAGRCEAGVQNGVPQRSG